MKRAFIVVGPESSGTRLLTKILIEGGCAGQSEHDQDFDTKPIEGDTIVWRRSFPHEHQAVYLSDLLIKLNGYKIKVVIIVRNWDAMEKSQMAAPHVSHINQATSNIKDAYLAIFSQISDLNLDFVIVTYESLILDPIKMQQKLLNRLNLEFSSENKLLNITNENAKWM